MSSHAEVAQILNRLARRAVELGRQVPGESDLVASILTRLPQLAGRISAGDSDAAGTLVVELIREINGLVSRAPKHGDFVVEAMSDLNELGAVSQIWGRPQPPSQPATPPTKKRTGEGVTYCLRESQDGQVVLVETRPEGDGRDFKVHKAEYDRAMQAITRVAADAWVKFDPIFDAYRDLHGTDTTNAYSLRVLLRFWRTQSPALVKRQRAHYQVTGSAGKFRKDAKAAWDALPRR